MRSRLHKREINFGARSCVRVRAYADRMHLRADTRTHVITHFLSFSSRVMNVLVARTSSSHVRSFRMLDRSKKLQVGEIKRLVRDTLVTPRVACNRN